MLTDEAELEQALIEVTRKLEVARAPMLQPLLDETALLEQQTTDMGARIDELSRALARMPAKPTSRRWWALVPLLLLWAPAVHLEIMPWWWPLAFAAGAFGLGRVAERFG